MYIVFAQRNVPGGPQVPWAGQRLGTCDGITIGSDGCYVCAITQVANHYEHAINPAQMDNRLTELHLYYQGCQMIDQNLSRLFPDILYRGTVSWAGPADLNWLLMKDDEEIVIGLDNLNQGAKSRHFVRVNDYNPRTGVVLIDDPWWGAVIDFRYRYGDPRRNIMKGVRFQKPGWIPPWKRPAAPVIVTPPVPAVVLPPVIVTAPGPTAQELALQVRVADLEGKLQQSATAIDAMTALYNRDEAAIALALDVLTKRKGA